jgi:hypothetical protein
MSETELKLKRKELGILIFRTFTRELIVNSGPVSIAKLKTIIEKDHEFPHHKQLKKEEELAEEERRRIFQERFKKRKLKHQIIQREQARILMDQKRNEPKTAPLRLSVPETRLPERFSYLRPTPVEQQEEFGPKMDMLLLDPNVEAIECPGENQEVIVRGLMGEQRTEIKMNKKEIDDLINKFSELTKIPVTEGIYKVVFGNLILLAVVSEVVGSKFLIKKMRKKAQLPPLMFPEKHEIKIPEKVKKQISQQPRGLNPPLAPPR